MLCLSRKENETIVLSLDGGNTGQVEITVNEITPNRVRIGVTAPRDITVLRKELMGQEGGARQDR